MNDSEEPAQSPSLAALVRSAGPAYEIKFLVDESTAQRVDQHAREYMVPDPHGDPAHNGAYHTTTLYLDTPEMDVYYRSPSYRRRKFRIRRYGMLPWVFVERKSKGGDRVTKRRVQIAEFEIERFAAEPMMNGWVGDWFHRRIAIKRLQPACCVGYHRTALTGTTHAGPIRLTIDRHLHGSVCDRWHVPVPSAGSPLLAGAVILELKFLRILPRPFRELIEGYRLNPTAVSKYRLCREALGVATTRCEASHA